MGCKTLKRQHVGALEAAYEGRGELTPSKSRFLATLGMTVGVPRRGGEMPGFPTHKPSGLPVKATGTQKARPTNRGKALRGSGQAGATSATTRWGHDVCRGAAWSGIGSENSVYRSPRSGMGLRKRRCAGCAPRVLFFWICSIGGWRSLDRHEAY